MPLQEGDIWRVNLDNRTIGRELHGPHPALIISAIKLQGAPDADPETIIVIPLTSTDVPIRSRVLLRRAEVDTKIGEYGLTNDSYAICEQIKSIDTRRLNGKLGSIRPDALARVRHTVAIILGCQ